MPAECCFIDSFLLRGILLQTVLFVGMKLQQIITSLALEVMGGVEDSATSQGRRKGAKTQRVVAAKMLDEDLKADRIHAIKPRDDLFWFNRPRLLLYLVHFMLFQVINLVIKHSY